MDETKEQVNWLLEEYNQLCQRYRSDGEIFWNKITVLVSINFALFGILSLKLKEGALDLFFIIIINFLGLFFTLFWWCVIFRQAKWVDYWKKEIREIEKRRGFKIKVQTKGEDFNVNLNCLEIGSYWYVSHVLPISFSLLWIITLIYLLLK